MNEPPELISELTDIPRDDEGPVFNAPWEASAFALAVRLSREGHFTWSEWVAVLVEEIARAQREGDPDLGDTYYHHWVTALERLVAEKALIVQSEVDQRKEDWREAFLNTPHGEPVELAAAYRDRKE